MTLVGVRRVFVLALAVAVLGVMPASAQTPFGTFSWQMQPYCNSVTLSLTSLPTGFTIEGVDDQCGASTKGSAVGTAAFSAGGALALNFTIVLPSSRPVHVTALVSPANGEGSWKDGYGNTGTFKFFGTTPGLPPRPDGNVYFRAGSHQAALNGINVVFTQVSHNEGGGSYNTTTGAYTVPSAGLYSIAYSVSMSTGPFPFNLCAWVATTSLNDRASCQRVDANTSVAPSGSTVLPLQAGQSIEIRASLPTGGFLNVDTAGFYSLTIHKVR